MIYGILTHPLFIASLISFLMGSFGYVLVRFWMMPILRYHKIKKEILSALNSPKASNTAISNRTENGKTRLRKLSGELSSVYNNALPYWYRLLLIKRGQNPIQASILLMKLANTTNKDHAMRQKEQITAHLERPIGGST